MTTLTKFDHRDDGGGLAPPANSGVVQVPRDAHGRVLKGHSLNPRGRPQGSRSNAALAVQRIIGEHGPELAERAIQLALKGDTAMLKLLLDKLVPTARERVLDLSELPEPTTPAEATEAALAAVALMKSGELSMPELRSLVAILASLRVSIGSLNSDRLTQRLEDYGDKD